jgi:hypothetical protein
VGARAGRATVRVRAGVADVTARPGALVEVRLESWRVVVAAYAGSAEVRWTDRGQSLAIAAGQAAASSGAVAFAGARSLVVERWLAGEAVAGDDGPSAALAPSPPRAPSPPAALAPPSTTATADAVPARRRRGSATVAVRAPAPPPMDHDEPAPVAPSPVASAPIAASPIAPVAASPIAAAPAASAPGASSPIAAGPVAPSTVVPPAGAPVAVAPSPAATAPVGAAAAAAPSSPAAAALPVDETIVRESQLLAEAMERVRRHHDPDGALRLLDRYQRRFPDGTLRAEALSVRIDALLLGNRRAPALAELDAADLDRTPRAAELRVLRGELRASARRCAEAIVDFAVVLGDGGAADRVDGPLRERALFGRGTCRLAGGDRAGAAADLARYLSLFPDGRFAAAARRALASP